MSVAGGISAAGRDDLALVVATAPDGFVTVESAASALGAGRGEAARHLSRWAARGWLRRVARGLYVPVPVEASPTAWSADSWAVAARVWEPCYVSGWSAAGHWGLTEQVFRTTVVRTAARVRDTRPVLLDRAFWVSRVDPGLLDWGLRTEWREAVAVRVADPARTVIEVLDRPAIGGGIQLAAEILRSYLEESGPADLLTTAQRYGNRTVHKRLGYLAEAMGQVALAGDCRRLVSAGVGLLDPSAPAVGPVARRWGLRINIAVRLDRS